MPPMALVNMLPMTDHSLPSKHNEQEQNQSQWHQTLPTEIHQLIDSESRQRAADENGKQNDCVDLDDYPNSGKECVRIDQVKTDNGIGQTGKTRSLSEQIDDKL